MELCLTTQRKDPSPWTTPLFDQSSAEPPSAASWHKNPDSDGLTQACRNDTMLLAYDVRFGGLPLGV
jgi:hypothetical protein